MRRGWALVLVTLVLAACGGRDQVAPFPPDRPSGATRELKLPEPVTAVPAYRVDLRGNLSDEVRARLDGLPGVAVVGALATRRFAVTGPGGTERLLVGSTRPLRYRSVAPPATKDADFVWASLLGGEAVLSFKAGKMLQVEGAAYVDIGGLEGVSVGALADNGTPNLVDVLVADHIGIKLGLGGPTVLVIGAESTDDVEPLKQRLERLLDGTDARIRPLVSRTPAPIEPAEEPVGYAEGSAIGSMSFRILKDGFIDPDPAWEAANIVRGEVPILGGVTCHRLLYPQLYRAMEEVVEQGLSQLIDPAEYGGCYVPRFIDRNPDKPLSMHAFGLAFDINVSTNHLGTRGDMDPRIVEIIERWGFEWGGRWERPDPMHFELVRLIQT
ncbi:MAG: M15 family metallopeptidase [Actinomycetota bacterium]